MPEPIEILQDRADWFRRKIKKAGSDVERHEMQLQERELLHCLYTLLVVQIDLSFANYTFDQWNKLNYEIF